MRNCSQIFLTISDGIAECVSGTHFSEFSCPKFVSTISRRLSVQVRRLTRSSNLPKWAPSQSCYEPPWTNLASSTTRYRHTVLLKQLPCGGTFCSCAHVRQMRITLSRSHSWTNNPAEIVRDYGGHESSRKENACCNTFVILDA